MKIYNRFTYGGEKTFFVVLTWIFMVVSLLYLGYKLISYDNYSTLINEWKLIPPTRFYWLGLLFVLLPFNWITEALKWKIIVSVTQKLSLSQAVKSVLAGYSTGFFTPNRIGDLVGRLFFLESSNRKTGITLSLISSLTQNIVIALCGIPAAILFFSYKFNEVKPHLNNYFIFTSIIVLLFLMLFLWLPQLAKKNKITRINGYIKGFENYSLSKSLLILFMSLLRFTIFSFQFYALLHFFGVPLLFEQAFVAIPANYLFVTFTPSFAFAEPAIRGSYAVFFIGSFSAQTVGVALAGVSIWVVNYVFPMLLGYTFLLNHSSKKL
ncbi:MAG: lysylphosphatidylglycerol synthase domain-containing protein [Paludibacter sp.]|nr:lysylphosphatidylglycerol synthase domain-containing protein [Paludibacter sp.]